MNYQERFEEIYTAHITREGSKELLDWLRKTDGAGHLAGYRPGQHQIPLRL